MNGGFDRENQKMLALTSCHNENWVEKKTVMYVFNSMCWSHTNPYSLSNHQIDVPPIPLDLDGNFDCFATSEIAAFNSDGLSGTTILYTKLARLQNKAERLQRMRQPALGEVSSGKKSRRQTRERKRPSGLIEQFSSEGKGILRGRIQGRRTDSGQRQDFPDQPSISERRKSQRIK